MKNVLIVSIVFVLCSAFVFYGGDEPFEHNETHDRHCVECHTELTEPFESTPLPEVAKYRGRIVVVLERNGNVCNLSGIGFTAVAPCDELQYPRNWDFDVTTT